MSYSRNFGMRSFENIVRNGRFRAPKTGTPFNIGAPAVIDPATPGFLKAATAAAGTANAGIVVFEHIQMKGVDVALTTTSDSPFNKVPLGEYAQLVHGPGAKVWFKNTADKTLYDGRVQGGVDFIVALNALAVGDGLVPDGAGKFRKSVADESAWLIVEQINAPAGLVEARFTF